ncbi:hypothetical protein DID88_002629 [Monilinia fructigena]|uniref:O-methyltransferase C-terminal domain-containing protein n=1 Tax=Monilinia fructigena TaxID=38457 RepID=A0A395IPA7_9HELO|nr:hypothetical protein DID88_002629 [Monilinia fructigena]
MTAVNKLNSDVYGPVNNVIAQLEQIIYSGCLRVLLEAGVFDELPLDRRGMSSSDLAAKTNMEEALLVDIGGGQGHAIATIKKLTQDTRGRMILQEREEAIREIVDIEFVGIEKMTYDFFTPQPIQGALIYHIRRCLHDWPDAYYITILSNIANAMTPTSRLLIAEIGLPEEGGDTEASWLDITMLLFGGKERSENEWIKLLDVAGMRLERVYGAEGTKYSVLEAWLK